MQMGAFSDLKISFNDFFFCSTRQLNQSFSKWQVAGSDVARWGKCTSEMKTWTNLYFQLLET